MDPAGAETGRAAAEYADELRRWRKRRNLSQQKLADRMAYDRSYVSHIEGGKMAPTEGFTQLAEEVLDAGGSLWGRWQNLLDEQAAAFAFAEFRRQSVI